MSDLYKIAVAIQFGSNYQQILGPLLQSLAGIDKATAKAILSTKGLNDALVGLGSAAALDGVVRMTTALARAGAAASDARAKMLALGITPVEVDLNAKAAEVATGTVRGTTYADNMQRLIELRSVLTNEEEARVALPAFLTAERDLKLFNTQHGASISSENLLPAIKAAELQGAFVRNGKLDPAAASEAIKAAEAALEITNGVLTPQAFGQFTRMAGTAAQSMNWVQFLRDNTEAMMALGSTGGRGMQYAAKTFLGGQLTKANVDQLESLGMIRAEDVANDHGHFALKPGTLKGYQELLDKGFAQWFHDVVMPALAAKGFTGTSAVLQGLGSLPVTEQRLFGFYNTNWAQVEKFGGQFDTRMGTDANKALMDNSLTANTQAFTAAWTSFEQVMGEPLTNVLIPGLHGLTDALIALEHAAAVPGVGAGLDAAMIGGGLLAASITLRTLGGALSVLVKVMGGAEASTTAALIARLGGAATAAGSFAAMAGALVAVAGATAAATAGFEKLDEWLKSWKPSIFQDKSLQDIQKNGIQRPWWWPSFMGGASPGAPHGPNLNDYLPGHPKGANPEDAGAPTIQKQSFIPPPANQNPIQVTSNTYLDGKQIARTVSEYQADYAALPPSGTSMFDMRMTPLAAGQQVAA